MPSRGTPVLILAIPDAEVLYQTWKYLSVRYDLINKNRGEGRSVLSLN